MLLLVLSTSSISVVKATKFVWDCVHFVEDYEGEWIKYPHPDRAYYGISPYSTQGVDGRLFYHCQVDHATSLTIIATTDLLCALIGAKIAGAWGTLIGSLVGAALAVFITYVSVQFFFDEHNCIWFWVSLKFMNWLNDNGEALWQKGLIDPVGASAMILTMLIATGYIRVGTVTFLDTFGRGDLAPRHTVVGCRLLFRNHRM